MKFQRIFAFALISIVAGLVAAMVVLKLLPQEQPIVQEPEPPAPAPTIYRPSTQTVGPASYADAVQRATPAVVNIYTAKVTVQRIHPFFEDPLFKRFFGNRFSVQPRKRLQTSLGSGVILSPDGYIMTNHHVVDSADEIRVVLADGRTIQAEVIGNDPETDLALLHTDETNLPAMNIGDSDTLRVGDVVLAIGNPFGVGQTVTMGIVGATGRSQLGINTFENFIQTDAAINPGNSGGALVNAAGDLIGINTAIFSKSGGSHGIGFAIPVKLAESVMHQIITHGRVVRGWLGIAGQEVTPQLARSFQLKEVKGILISGVLEGGPADNAGIRPGDIITQIGNHTPENARDALHIISMLPPGEKVKIKGWRGQNEMEAEVTVIERPPQQ
jgi:serine protease DegS